MDIGDDSHYVNIMTTGELLPGTTAQRIASPTAIGINGQSTRHQNGPLPSQFSLIWADRDLTAQVFTDGPEGVITQGPRHAINPRTLVYLVVGTAVTTDLTNPYRQVTFILGMFFDGEEACQVAGIFMRESLSFASNTGSGGARRLYADERGVMIHRHELWFVQTEGFSLRYSLGPPLDAHSSYILLCFSDQIPNPTPISP